jgi:hypothetical protein
VFHPNGEKNKTKIIREISEICGLSSPLQESTSDFGLKPLQIIAGVRFWLSKGGAGMSMGRCTRSNRIMSCVARR